uniref:FAD-dependent oxidoreductase n=1 Tax=Paractinoplanes polyasparticus TaxID=2856853 RepID=UPI001C848934|nr:FAD-dependent oxidoreductase [Actinoplanes polyasparticus]
MTFGTVCVIGASVAGLLAARALADHARRVVLLERDVLAAGPVGHTSVPQGRHGHFLQPNALEQLEDWFPGFTDDAVARGAVPAPPGHHRLYMNSEPMADWDATLLTASRPFLEQRIRSRVTGIAGVEVRHVVATGLRYRDKAVAGVAHRTPGGPATERVLEADLTVDAMGRGTSLVRWLEQGGFPALPVQWVPVGIGYTTALFRRSPDDLSPTISCALDQFTPGVDGRGLAAVAVYAIEGDLWQVVGMAYGRDREDATVKDLRGLCAGLPDIFRKATAGEPVGGAETYFYTDNRRRRVADLERFPAGLVDIGDAVATSNPIHGIGMASAVKQASVLADFLAGNSDPAGRTADFLRMREAVVDEAWTDG